MSKGPVSCSDPSTATGTLRPAASRCPRYSIRVQTAPARWPSSSRRRTGEGQLLRRPRPPSSMARDLFPVGGHLVDGAPVDDGDRRRRGAGRCGRSPWRCRPPPPRPPARRWAADGPSRTERRKAMPSSTPSASSPGMPRRLATWAPDRHQDRAEALLSQGREGEVPPRLLAVVDQHPESARGRRGRRRCAPGAGGRPGWPRPPCPRRTGCLLEDGDREPGLAQHPGGRQVPPGRPR